MPDTKKHGEMKKPDSGSGTLYVVATPIGNLEDITMRALRILGEVDLIACEDTRHTRKLLSHFDIHTRLISYYKDKERSRAEKIVALLAKGKSIALVSDAGTPGISDPGSILVREAHRLGLPVIPIPGPSALTAALSIAGLQEQQFVFLGFPPPRKSQRQNLFKSLSLDRKTLVFYESPHRLPACLRDCLEILGDRPAIWARELTKIHEELQEGPLSELLSIAENRKIRGESVVIIEGSVDDNQFRDGELDEVLAWCRDNCGLSLKDAVKKITAETGRPRSEVYREALKIWKDKH